MEKNILNTDPLLEVKNFTLSFLQYEKGLRETKLQVIKNLNITIHKGEIVAIVGASGSGKSLLANALLGILPNHAISSGTLKFKGKELTKEETEKLRGKEISLIPQSINALDPLMKTEKQVQEGIHTGNKQEKQRNIFKKVGLPFESGTKYPFELSGGMARRVLGATAMVSSADLIIADEPTPGIDPEALHDTLSLMKQLADDGKGIMFITHDIASALEIADNIVVIQKGTTIETAPPQAFSGKGEKLKDPYTKALWNALPRNTFFSKREGLSNSNSLPKMDSKEKLEVKKISYKYKNGTYLFRDLCLTVNPGEIVGLHGYSGTGKTTMARVIAGYLKPENGVVTVNGKQTEKLRIQPIQLVWQHPEKAINPRWQMKKVLSESGMLKNPLLDELEIKKGWLTRWPSELSGGELQRFCIARALTKKTKYLIADEMTTMLDTVTQANLWELVWRLAKEQNIGVLAISHDHDLLNGISDRVIDFHDISNV